MTHPTWIGYYAGHPSVAVRDGVRLLILVFLISWLLPTASVPEVGLGLVPVIDSTPSNSDALGSANGASDGAQDSPRTKEQSFNRTEVERYVWQFTNKRRVDNGLNRLEYAPRIVPLAREHAQNMAEHDYVGHTQPNGQTGKKRYQDVCDYRGSGYTFGENAIGAWYNENYEDTKTGNSYYADSERELARHLVARWMNSTDHRENILNPSWKELGAGVHKRDDGKVFATQTFC